MNEENGKKYGVVVIYHNSEMRATERLELEGDSLSFVDAKRIVRRIYSQRDDGLVYLPEINAVISTKNLLGVQVIE